MTAAPALRRWALGALWLGAWPVAVAAGCLAGAGVAHRSGPTWPPDLGTLEASAALDRRGFLAGGVGLAGGGQPVWRQCRERLKPAQRRQAVAREAPQCLTP